MSLIAALALAAQASAPHAFPPEKEARARIAAADARLFHAAFEGCNPQVLGEMLTGDFRMVHDNGGLAVKDRASFVAGMTQQCAERAAGGANEGYANRRRLVPGSRRLQPLGDWGALEEAHHTFHERQADGSWKLVGGARYVHV